jgi:hypothetical protein
VISNTESKAESLETLIDLSGASFLRFLEARFPLPSTCTNAQPANAGGYSVVVTNAGGMAVSATAALAVVVPAFAMKNFQVKTNGTFHFEFSGTANQTYSLWTSANLVQWQQIGFSTQDTPGQFEANDPAATNYSSRFYELRWP